MALGIHSRIAVRCRSQLCAFWPVGAVVKLPAACSSHEDEFTWEPPQNIKDKALLNIWRKRKVQELYGIELAFDLAKFEERRGKGGKFDQDCSVNHANETLNLV